MQIPIRNGARPAASSAPNSRRANVPTKNAASSTLRASTPIVSRLGESDLTPAVGKVPKVGL